MVLVVAITVSQILGLVLEVSMMRLLPTLVSLMLVHSFLLRPRSICIVGVKTQSSLLSSNLTARTASLNVKELTLILYSHTSTIPVAQTLVLTSTHLPYAPKNINQAALATSRVLITPHFSSFCLMPLLRVPRLLRSAFMPLTTTSCVL